TQPVCGPGAARHLEMMLGGTHREALPGWLQAAARTGARVPERLLPELLQAGRQHRDLRGWIAAVAGRRGRWLAQQNPDWAYLASEEDEVLGWETSPRAARQLHLQVLRATDPARAREQLAQTWEQEGADERAAFL